MWPDDPSDLDYRDRTDPEDPPPMQWFQCCRQCGWSETFEADPYPTCPHCGVDLPSLTIGGPLAAPPQRGRRRSPGPKPKGDDDGDEDSASPREGSSEPGN